MSDEYPDATINLSKQIVTKLLETKKRIPTRIKAGLYLHEVTTNYGCKPQVLAEYVLYELLVKLFKSKGIRFISTISVEVPFKGGNLYLNEFRTKDDMPIYCSTLNTSYPELPISSLIQSVFEFFAEQGCTACRYGFLIDEDEICSFCRNGETKQKLKEILGNKTFAETGWINLRQAIGTEYFEIIEDLARFNKKFFVDDDFSSKCEDIIDECQNSDSYGNYIGKYLEDILFMNDEFLGDGSSMDDGDEDDDDEEQSIDPR